MSVKTRTKSNLLQNYEECLKQGIPIGKVYGSDFTDGFIVKQYSYPPYPWNSRVLLSDNKKIFKPKSKVTVQKKKKLLSTSKKVKSKSVQRSKLTKKKQRKR